MPADPRLLAPSVPVDAMSPTEILAAARSRVVGPHLPAKPEWLEGWIGPIRWQAVADGPMRIGAWGAVGSSSETPTWGIVTSTDGHDRSYSIYLDVHRPEVRDHLVRLGCPAWARDVPAAVWCWGMGVSPTAALGPWFQDVGPSVMLRRTVACDTGHTSMQWPSCSVEGWDLPTFPGGKRGPSVAKGPETGDEGRACADIAALRANHILREPGGWLVPLPGGEVGFFPEVTP